jgi:hypothetical protein
MKALLNKIKTKHVSYEVLTAAVLHLSEAEQVKVNNLITKSLGLPVHATTDSIKQQRQIKIDELTDYDVILDAFRTLKRTTEWLEIVIDGSEYPESVHAHEALADAQMLLASIKHE